MAEAVFSGSGGYEPKRLSPTSFAIVIALHGAAITALALAKTVIVTDENPPTVVRFIEEKQDPPPIPEKTQETEKQLPVQHESVVNVPEREVDLPVNTGVEVEVGPRIPVIPVGPAGPTTVVVDPPKPAPIRLDAEIDPRFADRLQPPYPPSEERAGQEGQVRIRVLIGANGRVKAAEKLFATNDAFYRAAERQALREWRFKPATVDGRPVESRKVFTLQFELKG